MTPTISHFMAATHTVRVFGGLPNSLSWTRLLLVPVLWLPAIAGQGRLVGVGLIIAGLTDFLDGYLARRLRQPSTRGAQLDALADTLLLLSAAAWIELLHPEILGENTVLLAATFATYVTALAVGLVRFGNFKNLHLHSTKVAGGLMYAFGVVTLILGAYEPLLLRLAAAAFIVASAETLIAELWFSGAGDDLGSVLLLRKSRTDARTIQAIGSARKQRSQSPQLANPVGTSAAPASSIAAAAAPNANNQRP
jgi:phosphatidylglycerophosphate synthase